MRLPAMRCDPIRDLSLTSWLPNELKPAIPGMFESWQMEDAGPSICRPFERQICLFHRMSEAAYPPIFGAISPTVLK